MKKLLGLFSAVLLLGATAFAADAFEKSKEYIEARGAAALKVSSVFKGFSFKLTNLDESVPQGYVETLAGELRNIIFCTLTEESAQTSSDHAFASVKINGYVHRISIDADKKEFVYTPAESGFTVADQITFCPGADLDTCESGISDEDAPLWIKVKEPISYKGKDVPAKNTRFPSAAAKNYDAMSKQITAKKNEYPPAAEQAKAAPAEEYTDPIEADIEKNLPLWDRMKGASYNHKISRQNKALSRADYDINSNPGAEWRKMRNALNEDFIISAEPALPAVKAAKPAPAPKKRNNPADTSKYRDFNIDEKSFFSEYEDGSTFIIVE